MSPSLKAFWKGEVCKEQLSIVRNGYRSMKNGKKMFSNNRYDKKISRDFKHRSSIFWRLYWGKKKKCKIVDIEKFVSHFSKTMGEEMERRTQNDEGDICIMNPIMGPQAVKRIYSQEDINGDLNYLNKRISEGEVTEVVKNISNSKQNM